VPPAIFPAKLEQEGAKRPGPVQRLSMRVYAEDDFRHGVEGWQVRFFKMIERASSVLHGAFGIEIEIIEMKDWPNHASFASLDGALIDLESVDKAEDVDLVVGLIAPVPMATPSFHQIGISRILGHHLVLRGMNDSDEYQNLVQTLSGLGSDDRERLYEARLRHKELVIFLHELGHLFGAIHLQDTESFLNDPYNDHMRYFGDPTLKIVGLVLDEDSKVKRAKDKLEPRRPEVIAKMIEFFQKSEKLGFTGYEREKMIALLQSDRLTLARATDRDIVRDEVGTNGGHDDRSPLPQIGPKTESERLKDASELASNAKYEEAWLVLKPIAEAHPADKEIQSFACQLGAIREPKAEESLVRCKTAVEAGPTEPTPALYAAYVLLQMGREEDAFPLVREAESRLAKKKDARADLWVFLAELYQGSHAVSLAESAIEHATSAEGPGGAAADRAKPILEWAKHTREAYGLDPQMSPEDERAYLLARSDLEASLREDRLAEAEKKNEAIRAKFPAMPGAETQLCEFYLAHRNLAKAEALCTKAAKAEPGRAKPHALLGLIAFSKGSLKSAIAHLETARQKAPDDPDVMKTLIAVYRAAGRRQDANTLEREYRRKFGAD
jgi:predicted Zn-dependent protease